MASAFDFNKVDLNDNYNSNINHMKQSIGIVINGNLDEKAPKQTEYSGLENTVLRNHQKTLLYKMYELETNSLKPDCRFVVNSNIGVIGDVVGAGKSLPVLMMIHNTKKELSGEKVIYHSYNKTCNVSISENKNNSDPYWGKIGLQ